MQPSCSRRRAGLSASLAALGLGLSACAGPTVQQEQAGGDEFFRQITREVDLLSEPVVVGYVQGIGDEILRHIPPQPFVYHFYVIEDDDINAFAGPAGHVFVNTGTILKARNLSELAGVIAHEIGHVVERHVAENMGRQRTAGLLHRAAVLGTSLLAGGAAASAVNLGGGLATMGALNSFGREAEREADTFAVDAMVRSGIDPMGLLTFFELLERQGGSGVPQFLSSHPATAERIENTRREIEAADAGRALRVNDGGRLEIIQRRIGILTHRRPG